MSLILQGCDKGINSISYEVIKSAKHNEIKKKTCITFILDTASSACIILVVLVGCPSQTSWVEPRYLALNKTPSIKTERWMTSRKMYTRYLVNIRMERFGSYIIKRKYFLYLLYFLLSSYCLFPENKAVLENWTNSLTFQD